MERLSQFDQRQITRDALRGIKDHKVSPVLDMCFRRFWDLKSRIEGGKDFCITDLDIAMELHRGFEAAYGDDTDLILKRWREEHDKERAKLKDKIKSLSMNITQNSAG